MAASGGGQPVELSQRKDFQGQITRKLPKNPLQRLQYRELGGLHKQQSRCVSNQVFHKLPGRLGFNLRSLVDESVLHEGHVFLGFSKNGQFVLSYTLHVEADENTAYPIYVYRLQWWQFIPYKRLRKVSEVRLFGGEDIQQDLYIAICEWPSDETRVLVYGYCSPSDNEEKHLCYITITAVPPITPCDDCNHMTIIHAQNGFHATLYDAPPRCLNHAFTVHTKYELAPPYPSFAPKIYLRLDGVLIVNTGDSLIALSVDIEDNHGGFGFGLYSPRVTRSASNISTASSSPSDDRMSCDSQEAKPLEEVENTRPLEETENTSDTLFGVLAQSPTSHYHVYSPRCSYKDTMYGDMPPPAQIRERHSSTGKENLLSSPLSSHGQVDGANMKAHRSMDIYNFEGSTPKKEDDEYGDSAPNSPIPAPSRPMRATLSFSGFQQTASLSNSSNTEEINLYQGDTLDSQTLVEDFERQDLFEKPTGMLRLKETLNLTAVGKTLPGLTLIPPENFGLGKNMCISPGCGKLDQAGSSTCSSCISSPIILTSESQCFTYSVRKYMECFGGIPDSTTDMEDDLNLAYHSVLPLEVHGANYCSMRLLNKQHITPHMPCVVVKQLTLDIEHYLAETVRTSAEWGHRYLAFTNYDVQIVEVCPDTHEVIALVFVLIRARPPGLHKDQKHPHCTRGMRSVPKLYQSGFKLIWNLQTGSYNTLDVQDLVEVNQAELLRTKKWQPGHRICDSLQRRFAVPQIYSRSVHVLTNEAVFKGQSLKMLLDRHHYVAILL